MRRDKGRQAGLDAAFFAGKHREWHLQAQYMVESGGLVAQDKFPFQQLFIQGDGAPIGRTARGREWKSNPAGARRCRA